MSNFNAEFKKILKNLENNISDEKSLEAAKVEMFNLYNLFFDEITNLEQTVNTKILAIAESQLHVEEKIKEMNKSIKNIEKDIYMDEEFDEDEDYDVEIRCPYCDKTFTAAMDELTGEEITCPECSNTIELDWGEGCSCGCGEHDCDCGEEGCDCGCGKDDCDCSNGECHCHEEEDL